MTRYWLSSCMALCLLAAGSLAAEPGALSDEQVDRLTEALSAYRTTWNVQNTLELIQRADSADVKRFALMSDGGDKVVIEFTPDGGVLVDGDAVIGGTAQAIGPGPWPYLSLVLGVCLVVSLMLNLRLVAFRRGTRGRHRGSEVIRSISRL